MFAVVHKRKKEEKSISLLDYNKAINKNVKYRVCDQLRNTESHNKCTCCHYELSHSSHSKLVSVLLCLNLSMHFDLTDIHLQTPKT